MLAWVILLLGAVLLGVLWPGLPETWVIHYGVNGEPNGWAHKDFFGVFFPLLLGAFMVGTSQMLKPLARATNNPWAKTPEAAEKLNEMNAHSVDAICAALAIIMVVWSLILPLAPGMLVAGIVFTIGGILGATALIAYRMQSAMREMGAPKGFTGIAYNNPDDPRLWVPKLSGIGSTLNFAHPWAWPVMLALLALPVASILLVLYQAIHHA